VSTNSVSRAGVCTRTKSIIYLYKSRSEDKLLIFVSTQYTIMEYEKGLG
jgi:hypothetical protein